VVIFRRQFTLSVVCEGHRQDTPCATLSTPLLPSPHPSPLLPVASALFCRFLHRQKTQLFCFQTIPHSLPKTTGGWGEMESILSGSLSTLASKSFNCNTYGSPRKCCKQKTYGLAKFFSCNTYKKHRGPLSSIPSLLTHSWARGGSLARIRTRRSRWLRPSRRKGALWRRR
jgi:hypothetical protein